MFYTYWDIWKELISNWDWDKIEIEQEVMAILMKEDKSYSVVQVSGEPDDGWILGGYTKPNKRILVSKSLEFDAVKVILARNDINHNHYGSAEEAAESKELEELLAELEIKLADYMVVSKKGYGSLWFATGGE